MKVNLRPIALFEVFNEAGQSLGNFEVMSEWEGFMKLGSARGLIMIVKKEGTEFSDTFSRIFGGPPPRADVITCSPALVEDIQRQVT